MSIYITIDGGTTNTRINLIEERKIIDTKKIEIGARKNMQKGDLLKKEIKKGIEKILSENDIKQEDILAIIASGMITSEFGICHLPHIDAPAGIKELAESIKELVIKEISDIPFYFIRGVKMPSSSFETADLMRGEETELMGILKEEEECIYVLPGSHSKIIRTDNTGRICGFSTMLTGEMIQALSENTILKDAVDLKTESINYTYLLKGYDYCKEAGINKALFKTRVLKNVFGADKEETYSFFIGAVLCGEIEEIEESTAKKVIIGGKAQIKKAIVQILKERGKKEVILLDEKEVNFSTSLGAVRIFERRNKFK